MYKRYKSMACALCGGLMGEYVPRAPGRDDLHFYCGTRDVKEST